MAFASNPHEFNGAKATPSPFRTIIVILVGLAVGLVAAFTVPPLMSRWFTLRSNDPPELPIGPPLTSVPIELPDGVSRVREFVPNPDDPFWALVPGRFVFRDHWNNEIVSGLRARFVWQLGRTDDMELAHGVYRTMPQLGQRGTQGWDALESAPGMYELPQQAWGKVLCLELQAEGGFIPATCAFRMTEAGQLSLPWGCLLASDTAIPGEVRGELLARGLPATPPNEVDGNHLSHPRGCLPSVAVLQAGTLSATFVDADWKPQTGKSVIVGGVTWLEGHGMGLAQPRQVLRTDSRGRCDINGVIGHFPDGVEGNWRNASTGYLPVVGQDNPLTYQSRSPYGPVVWPGYHVTGALFVGHTPPEGEPEDRGGRSSIDPEIIHIDGTSPMLHSRSDMQPGDHEIHRLGRFYVFEHDPGEIPPQLAKLGLLASCFKFQSHRGEPASGMQLRLRWTKEVEDGKAYGTWVGTVRTGPDGTCHVWAPRGSISAKALAGDWHSDEVWQPVVADQAEPTQPWTCHACGHLAIRLPENSACGYWSVRPTNLDGHGLGPNGWVYMQKFGMFGRGAFVTGLIPHDYLVGAWISASGLGAPAKVEISALRTIRAEAQLPVDEHVELAGPLWERLNGSTVSPRVYHGNYFLSENELLISRMRTPYGSSWNPESEVPLQSVLDVLHWRMVVGGRVSIPKTWIEWGLSINWLSRRLYTEPGDLSAILQVRPEHDPFDPSMLDLRPVTLRLEPSSTSGEIDQLAKVNCRAGRASFSMIVPVDGRDHTYWVPSVGAVLEGVDDWNPDREPVGEMEWFIVWTNWLGPTSDMEVNMWRHPFGGRKLWDWAERRDIRTICRVVVPEGRERVHLALELPLLPRAEIIGDGKVPSADDQLAWEAWEKVVYDTYTCPEVPIASKASMVKPIRLAMRK